MRNLTLVIILTFLSFYTHGQIVDTHNNQAESSIIKLDSLNVSVNLTDIERIQELFKKTEPSWFTTYGTLIVAILALIGAVVTSLLNNKRSRINTELQISTSNENIRNQLTESRNNLDAQILANRNHEIEKKKLELEYKLKTELKENIAKFIHKATTLNGKLNFIILSELEDGRLLEAQELYENTSSLRQELNGLYYSIRVTLDGSQKQLELERILEIYMGVVDFNFTLRQIDTDQYEQPIGQLFHKIKSIIHDNYQEPPLN